MSQDSHKERTDTPVTETLNQHVSIREYTDEPIPEDMLRTILNAARRSPTSSNMQAYTIVVVRDPQKKQKLSMLAGDQEHIRTCDVFIACCADISRLDTACQMRETTLAKNLENMLVASVDAAIMGTSLATAAESFGLGTVMIGGIRNDPQGVAQVLNFPQGVYCVYGMCLGWPDAARVKPQKPRLQEDVMIHYEQYDQRDMSAELAEYDAALAQHYRDEGRETPDAAWTGVIARKFSTPRRPQLRQTLENMGFSLD